MDRHVYHQCSCLQLHFPTIGHQPFQTNPTKSEPQPLSKCVHILMIYSLQAVLFWSKERKMCVDGVFFIVILFFFPSECFV